ncbi:MAG: hypothetical protein KC492_36650, partial [Myxococcales bacterium]|nr:hypothetical protein [Myxococcales bacterium]
VIRSGALFSSFSARSAVNAPPSSTHALGLPWPIRCHLLAACASILVQTFSGLRSKSPARLPSHGVESAKYFRSDPPQP